MKVCSRCNINKEDSEFRMRYEKRGKGSKSLAYLNNTCKTCDSEIQNRYYFANKDNPEFKEKWLKKSRDYYHKNSDSIKEKQRIKRQTPEYKEMMRSYRSKNKEKIYNQEVITKRRYQEKNRDGLTDKYIKQLFISNGVLDRDTIEAHPEFIEAKRLQILIQRKTRTHGN